MEAITVGASRLFSKAKVSGSRMMDSAASATKRIAQESDTLNLRKSELPAPPPRIDPTVYAQVHDRQFSRTELENAYNTIFESAREARMFGTHAPLDSEASKNAKKLLTDKALIAANGKAISDSVKAIRKQARTVVKAQIGLMEQIRARQNDGVIDLNKVVSLRRKLRKVYVAAGLPNASESQLIARLSSHYAEQNEQLDKAARIGRLKQIIKHNVSSMKKNTVGDMHAAETNLIELARLSPKVATHCMQLFEEAITKLVNRTGAAIDQLRRDAKYAGILGNMPKLREDLTTNIKQIEDLERGPLQKVAHGTSAGLREKLQSVPADDRRIEGLVSRDSSRSLSVASSSDAG